MINEDRIRLMTKLAVYEENEGKDALLLARYHEKDYLSTQQMKSFIYGTFSFFMLAAAAGFVAHILGAPLGNISVLRWLTILFVAAYIIFIGFYMFIAYRIAKRRYENGSEKLKTYYDQLKEIEKFYDNESEFDDFQEEW